MGKLRKNKSKGFSLIEVLFAVWIVGILSAWAFSSYEKYIVRAEISEAILYASRLKQDVVLTFETTGDFPQNIQRTIYTGEFIGSTNPVPTIYPDGTIMVLFGNQAHPRLRNQGIFLRPNVNEDNGVLTWDCGGIAYAPGGNSSFSYTIGPYLPLSCMSL